MDLDVLTQWIKTHLPCDYVKTNGDGRHFNAIIVSQEFAGLNTLKRQQRVYAFLSDKIASGDLHAFSMKTYTPEEWREEEGKRHG